MDQLIVLNSQRRKCKECNTIGHKISSSEGHIFIRRLAPYKNQNKKSDTNAFYAFFFQIGNNQIHPNTH